MPFFLKEARMRYQYKIFRRSSMQEIERVGFCKERRRYIEIVREIVFCALLCLLSLFASGAYAVDYVCTDCHTPQHGSCPDCISCHTKSLKYPMGPGMTGLLTDSATCVTCHLAGTTPVAVHAGTPINIQNACGQCHGGSAGPDATKNGAGYRTESYLSMISTGIHMPVNLVPVASFTSSISSYTVTLTDTSTDDAPFPPNAVTVTWGDGGILSTGNAGGSLSHTYATAGTFNIMYTIRDAGGLYSSVPTSVVVPQKFSITVNLSLPLTTSATFILKQNGITKATGTGTTSYTFSNRNSGTYQVQMTKSGYTFDGDPVTTGNQNPVTVTIGPNQTVTFTHTP
jgi:PKD repeat protein